MTQDPDQSNFVAEPTAEVDHQPSEAIDRDVDTTHLIDLAGALHPRQKISLIKRLITQLPSLELEVLQKLIESEEKNRIEREEGILPDPGDRPLHRIKIKKDYNFKKQGFPFPQQYFVSIAQKYRVHNDIYLGVLFFIKRGYPLNYVISKQGVVQFDPKTSLFRLESSIDRGKVKFVRLVMLIPPPPDYNVMKIRSGNLERIPCFLHVEILDNSFQIVDREQYQFPSCMYRREALDRDYWDIVSVVEETEIAQNPALDSDPLTSSSNSEASSSSRLNIPASKTKPVRLPRVISQPQMQPDSTAFIIVNKAKTSLMTSYLRQLSVLSQKAFGSSSWKLNLKNLNYRLLHSSENLIVEIRVNDQEVLIGGDVPLNVLSDWCRNLGVEVSQNASSTRYSEREREIARNLMIEFSAPIVDSLAFLEKFFYSIKGVQIKRGKS